MRNWNRQKAREISDWLSFLQYLWGIETVATIYVATICTGFYSTYEELKLFNIVITNIITYMFLQYLWGIETVQRKEEISVIDKVFTVPMRNWNRLFWTMNNLNLLPFLQYLWGIETHKVSTKLGNRCQFLQYLWGIETPTGCFPISTFLSFLQYLWGIETLVCKAL